MSEICRDDSVMCLDDINGHAGRHIDGLDGGYGVGQRNLEGKMLLESCVEKQLCIKERGKEEGDIQNW